MYEPTTRVLSSALPGASYTIIRATERLRRELRHAEAAAGLNITLRKLAVQQGRLLEEITAAQKEKESISDEDREAFLCLSEQIEEVQREIDVIWLNFWVKDIRIDGLPEQLDPLDLPAPLYDEILMHVRAEGGGLTPQASKNSPSPSTSTERVVGKATVTTAESANAIAAGSDETAGNSPTT